MPAPRKPKSLRNRKPANKSGPKDRADVQREAALAVAMALADENQQTFQISARVGRYRRSLAVLAKSSRSARAQARRYFGEMFPGKELVVEEVIRLG